MFSQIGLIFFRKNIFELTAIFSIFFFMTSIYSQSIYKNVPGKIYTSKKYMFYLHGKIIEDEGIRPTSPKYGVYEYEKILDTLAGKGFEVISERRKKNTDPEAYARKVAGQVNELLQAGVAPSNITVLGASKGAFITVLTSNLLKNDNMNFVIIAICNKGTEEYWKKNNIYMSGNVLYIYDEKDEIAGSCGGFFKVSKSKGLKKSKEIELHLGLGHGVLFKPLKEWVEPAVNWALYQKI